MMNYIFSEEHKKLIARTSADLNEGDYIKNGDKVYQVTSVSRNSEEKGKYHGLPKWDVFDEKVYFVKEL